MNKRIFKRVPSKDYESDYDLSDALIENIASNTREPWSGVAPMTAIEVAMKLAAGETIMLASPFTTDPTEVRWSLEVPRSQFKKDEDSLLEGEGPLWEVRVVCDLDETENVDFEVRAPSEEAAADKAEAHARKYADFYFGEPPEPTYSADRVNIYRIEDEPDLNDDEDQYAPWPHEVEQ